MSDIDLKKLLNFHLNHKKIATLTAVHPPARFGELELTGSRLTKFDEKPQLTLGLMEVSLYLILKYLIF